MELKTLLLIPVSKDVKNLTGSLEEIFFQIEDVLLKLNDFEQIISSIENF